MAQRVVLVVALAGLLAFTGSYIVSDGFSQQGGGWFAYAPNTNRVFYPRGGLAAFAALLVWVALLIVWAVASLWLFGLPAGSTGGDNEPGK